MFLREAREQVIRRPVTHAQARWVARTLDAAVVPGQGDDPAGPHLPRGRCFD